MTKPKAERNSTPRKSTRRDNVTIVQVIDPLCAQVDPDLFFPSEYSLTLRSYENQKEAKSICAKCEYTTQCLMTAMMNKEEYGIWGGATPRERKGLRTKNQVIAFVSDLKKPQSRKKKGK